MRGFITEARDAIELRLTLSVILGQLDETIAQIWKDAIRSLDDREIEQLIRCVWNLPEAQLSSATLKFLMDKYYPFRELILYGTDDEFKRRMGLLDFECGDEC